MIIRHLCCSIAALASTSLLSSGASATQGKEMARPKHQHCVSGSSTTMAAGNSNRSHGGTTSSPDAAHSTKMPAAKKSAQKMSGCGASQEAEPKAMMETPNPHAKHGDPATATPKPKSATDRRMPRHDQM